MRDPKSTSLAEGAGTSALLAEGTLWLGALLGSYSHSIPFDVLLAGGTVSGGKVHVTGSSLSWMELTGVCFHMCIHSFWIRMSFVAGASNVFTSNSRSGRLLHWIIELAPFAKLWRHHSCHRLLAVNLYLFSSWLATSSASFCSGWRSHKSISVSRILRQKNPLLSDCL